jgi:putative endonuclease
LKKLVYYQAFEDIRDAIQRETSIKRWPRQWKINLIEQENPHWFDLFPLLTDHVPIRRDGWPGQAPGHDD